MVSKISEIAFGVLSPQAVKSLARVRVVNSDLYDADGYPVEGGVMDPRLGVIDPGLHCRTCGGGIGECMGHFGYLELAKPIVNVLYTKTIYQLLRMVCKKCGRILIIPPEGQEKKPKRKTSEKTIPSRCPHCKAQQKKITFVKPYTFYQDKNELSSETIRERFEKIPDKDLRKIGFRGGRPEWLIVTLFPIPPVTMRPSITLESGERSEDDLTHKLVDVVRINQSLKENIDIGAPEFILNDLWELVQYHISTYFDNELTGVPLARHRSGRPLKGLVQRLKAKEGRIRGNLLGKRVNFSARTVISPDPKISINEVGVPEVVARELTIPEYVTPLNTRYVKDLFKLDKVNYVVRADGRRIKVTIENKKELVSNMGPDWIAERQLQDGDIVLFNRQPSLHRISIMAHRVRVMPYKTFRMNPSVCPPYNADFDGDEMNLHALQTQEARTEATFLMDVKHNIISPKFGGPIIGLDLDQISGVYLLTMKETVLSKEETAQLLSDAGIDIDLPDREKFTGKEIFSFLLPKELNIEFKAHACRNCDTCNKQNCPYDCWVTIDRGILKRGVVDKVGVGAEKGKIIGRLHRLVDNDNIKDFIDNYGRLGTAFLMKRGFSLGISDLDLPDGAHKTIREEIDRSEKESHRLINQYNKKELKILPGMTPEESLEAQIMNVLASGVSRVGDIVSENIKKNDIFFMSASGAKGSLINTTQMAAVVGQETILGKRIKRGYLNRTLPHIKPYDLSPRSHGFVSRGFKDGLRPFELFWNIMNGREGLMDKSLRTRKSGYMQRRLVNALQDLKVNHDGSIRNAHNQIVQFTAGEDMIDPSKSDWGNLDWKEFIEAQAVKLYVKEAKDMNTLPLKVREELDDYFAQHRISEEKKKETLDIVKTLYAKSSYDPEEPVGVVAAQSLSEPATQMTMRTYHFAGTAGIQVTLGLPRMLEIFDARREPRTPTMSVYIEKDYQSIESVRKIASSVREVKAKDVIISTTTDLTEVQIRCKLDMKKLASLDMDPQKVSKCIRLRNTETLVEGDYLIVRPKKVDLKNLHKLKYSLLESHIKGIRGISQVVVTKEEGEWIITTLGSNLKKVYEIEGVDYTRTVSNNIFEVLDVLGVEAARNVIIKQAKYTMEEQGLGVDVRYIMLLADLMTVRGNIRAIGRYGISGQKASVLVRASFEETKKHLTSAAIRGEKDDMRGTIENIMMNQVAPIGTGAFTLIGRIPGLAGKWEKREKPRRAAKPKKTKPKKAKKPRKKK